MERRGFLTGLLGGTLASGLRTSDCLLARESQAGNFQDSKLRGSKGNLSPIEFLSGVNDLYRGVSEGKMSQLQWQFQFENLASLLSLPKLKEKINFDTRVKQFDFTHMDYRHFEIDLKQLGVSNPIYRLGIIGIQKGKKIPIHYHNKYLMAYIGLASKTKARIWDRVDCGPDYLVLTPSRMGDILPGDATSLSSYRDNVHAWDASDDAMSALLQIDALYPPNPHYKFHNQGIMVYFKESDMIQLAPGLIQAKVPTILSRAELEFDHDTILV